MQLAPREDGLEMREVARIELPAHRSGGGFDHAAIDPTRKMLYVAHTSNDRVAAINLAELKFSHSLPNLKGVAGVWVSTESKLLFTSNRGENTASVFRLPDEQEMFRLATGERPNGLALDPQRETLLVAGVGNAESKAPPTVTLFDARLGRRLGQINLPGRTRWATYHAASDAFYVNIAEPPSIAVLDASATSAVRRFLEIPAAGPHGLEQDPDGKLLYCACDDGRLVTIDITMGSAQVRGTLTGPPDVVWVNPRLRRLYVAIGDPGVVDVFSTPALELVETFKTAPGAHTLTVDVARNQVHVFLPESHEDLVLQDA